MLGEPLVGVLTDPKPDTARAGTERSGGDSFGVAKWPGQAGGQGSLGSVSWVSRELRGRQGRTAFEALQEDAVGVWASGGPVVSS